MSGNFKIAGVGEVLWDVFPEGEKFGGAPANFTCHCSSLGADAYVISCLGGDQRGKRALGFLRSHGINLTGLTVDGAYETGVVLVTVDENGKPEYEIKEGVAWDHIPWNDELARIASAMDAVCFGSLCQRHQLSRSAIRRFVSATPSHCMRVFDVNLRQQFYSHDIIRESLELADVLKLNDEELPVVARVFGIQGSDEHILDNLIHECSLKLIALTRGEQGAVMVTETETSALPAPDVEVVNTVGAGDCFTAAMVMGFLAGKPLNEINENANRLAAFVCTQAGAVPALPEELR
jgi:fructokinase